MSTLTDFLSQPSHIVAPQLLGCTLERIIDGRLLRAKIIETEAYTQTDAASHSYRGKTARTEVMFGPSGHAYVYFTYGMHYCFNIVTGAIGEGSAVLVRAVEPLDGVETMMCHRGKTGVELTNGPAKLCQALRINKELNGHDLSKDPLTLTPSYPLPTEEITQTTRIGISQAKDIPWRFYISSSPYVSKK